LSDKQQKKSALNNTYKKQIKNKGEQQTFRSHGKMDCGFHVFQRSLYKIRPRPIIKKQTAAPFARKQSDPTVSLTFNYLIGQQRAQSMLA